MAKIANFHDFLEKRMAIATTSYPGPGSNAPVKIK
jgi:hypothetical protein